MTVRLIAVDLDGTLLENDHMTLPHKNLRAIEDAVGRGVSVVPATGRTQFDIPASLRELPGIRYLITSNGAEVVDLQNGKSIFSSSIPRAIARDVVKFSVSEGIYTEIYSGGLGYSEKGLKSSVMEQNPLYRFLTLVAKRSELEDLSGFIANSPSPIEKIELLPGSETASKVISAFLEGLPLTVTTAGMSTVEITNADTSKAKALEFLCGLLEINASEVMAIGDGMNDAEMLKWAGVSVAVGNADEELKRLATFVSLSNDQSGVAFAIDKFRNDCQAE